VPADVIQLVVDHYLISLDSSFTQVWKTLLSITALFEMIRGEIGPICDNTPEVVCKLMKEDKTSFTQPLLIEVPVPSQAIEG
jgi:hypothetical protein